MSNKIKGDRYLNMNRNSSYLSSSRNVSVSSKIT